MVGFLNWKQIVHRLFSCQQLIPKSFDILGSFVICPDYSELTPCPLLLASYPLYLTFEL